MGTTRSRPSTYHVCVLSSTLMATPLRALFDIALNCLGYSRGFIVGIPEESAGERFREADEGMGGREGRRDSLSFDRG